MRPVMLLAVVLLVGCEGAGRGGPRGVAGRGGQPFAAQVAEVRAGRADRIVAAVPPTAEEWESLRGMVGLRELVLQQGVADDSRAVILASLPDIERLVLRESPLSDAGFRSLAGCRTLRDLNVPRAACTAGGVRELRSLPSLDRLRLGGPNLAGGDLPRAVAGLPRLRSLHLIDVPVGDEGLATLAGLAGLRSLYLDGAGVSAEAWERYCQARPEVHVHVDQAHHDRDPRRGHD